MDLAQEQAEGAMEGILLGSVYPTLDQGTVVALSRKMPGLLLGGFHADWLIYSMWEVLRNEQQAIEDNGDGTYNQLTDDSIRFRVVQAMMELYKGVC